VENSYESNKYDKMISVITYKNAPEEIEIIADDRGVDDLMLYLKGIKEDKDHMHLVIDSEIDKYPIPQERKDQITIIEHIRLQFASCNDW